MAGIIPVSCFSTERMRTCRGARRPGRVKAVDFVKTGGAQGKRRASWKLRPSQQYLCSLHFQDKRHGVCQRKKQPRPRTRARQVPRLHRRPWPHGIYEGVVSEPWVFKVGDIPPKQREEPFADAVAGNRRIRPHDGGAPRRASLPAHYPPTLHQRHKRRWERRGIDACSLI